MEGVFVRPGCLSACVAPDGGGPPDQVAAVYVVAGVDPLPRLLVLPQSGVQPPVDPGAVQVHQPVPVDAQTGDGREPFVQTHQHREVRVRKQDRLHVRQRWQGNCRAEEVLVVPFRDPTSIR